MFKAQADIHRLEIAMSLSDEMLELAHQYKDAPNSAEFEKLVDKSEKEADEIRDELNEINKYGFWRKALFIAGGSFYLGAIVAFVSGTFILLSALSQ